MVNSWDFHNFDLEERSLVVRSVASTVTLASPSPLSLFPQPPGSKLLPLTILDSSPQAQSKKTVVWNLTNHEPRVSVNQLVLGFAMVLEARPMPKPSLQIQNLF